jgi:hypothetical protein
MLILALLTERGSLALSNTLSGTTNSQSFRAERQALVHAEAGLAEAKARLLGSSATNTGFIGDLSGTPNPFWSAYLVTSASWKTAQDPDYDSALTNYFPKPGKLTNTKVGVNSLQTSIPYWAKVRHKREYDAEREGHTSASPHYLDNDGSTAVHTAADPGNIVYYGYDPVNPTTPVQFTTGSMTTFQPVEVLTVYGQSGDQTKVVQAEIVRPVGPNIEAAMYVKADISFQKSSSVDGTDDCGLAAAKPPVFLHDPATASGSPSYNGSPASPQSGVLDIDVQGLINSLKAGATVLTADQSGRNYGSSSNYVTVYSNTSNPVNLNGLKISYGTGYGILLVEGDFVVGSDFLWNGLILVTGQVTFSAKYATSRIKGAILANQTSASPNADLYGNMRIKYHSCYLAKALSTKPLAIMQWKGLS